MPKRPRWFVFADDAGDPSPRGSPHFGYALLAVERDHMSDFTEARARFRVEQATYGEAKRGSVRSAGFKAVMRHASSMAENGHALCAATFITKERYDGYWLNPKDGKPASPHFLRNYILRKGLELLFEGHPDVQQGSMEVIIDRVRYNFAQIENLQRYLNGEFAEHGRFSIPLVTDVTHADSLYADGLQVADHIARFAHRLVAHPEEADEHLSTADPFLRICTVLSAQSFALHPDAAEVIKRDEKRA